ncbi:MAG: helix-turn-helix transcriptional regulator [Alphaproteobacteria bacterium]|nr:helix-turn-helix transcriptional regulator [Alphaproteobacteria bacterium]
MTKDDLSKETASAIDKQVGRNIRLLRRARRLSQARLADVLGVSFQQLQKYERGANRLSVGKLYMLKLFFGVPYERFYQGAPASWKTGEASAGIGPGIDPALDVAIRKIAETKDPLMRRNILQIIDILTG